jgi:hypothetical protein
MENVAKMIPFLWEIIRDKKKRAVNVSTKEDVITISILLGKHWKRFKNTNPDVLMSEIRKVI